MDAEKSRLRIARRIALLILAVGLAGIAAAVVGALLFADNAQLRDVQPLLFGFGLLYVVVALALLLVLRRRPARTPVVPPLPPAFVELPDPLPLEGDDLTAIDGIWLRMQDALKNAGIKTYAQLAGTPPETLRHIVRVQHKIVFAGSTEHWIAQARFLAAGDDEGLRTYLAAQSPTEG